VVAYQRFGFAHCSTGYGDLRIGSIQQVTNQRPGNHAGSQDEYSVHVGNLLEGVEKQIEHRRERSSGGTPFPLQFCAAEVKSVGGLSQETAGFRTNPTICRLV
jgi:hypothetical protein